MLAQSYFPSPGTFFPGTYPDVSNQSAICRPSLSKMADLRPGMVSPNTSRHFRGLELEDEGVVDEPEVELEGRYLWEKFHEFESEMVITKSGR